MREAEGVQLGARIKVVGVGGGGGNAVNTMIAAGLQGVDFMTANTGRPGAQSQPGVRQAPTWGRFTKGLGAGGNPRSAARLPPKTSSASVRC